MSRIRATSGTIYVNAAAGSDSADGLTPATAVQSIQCALDHAAADFDIAPPFAWGGAGNVGYRPAVTVQLAPAPASAPYLLPAPAYLDGLGCSGPILLRGDPSSRASILSYNIHAANSLQGLTAQNGGVLIVDGFTIRGDPDCTTINALEGGKIGVRNVFIGGIDPVRHPSAIGAAGGSHVDLLATVTLIGAGFGAVFCAIEDSMLSWAPGAVVAIDNAMNFGLMVDLQKGAFWTQGSPPSFTGAIASSTGQSYVASDQSYLGFDHTLIPGSPGLCDATSIIY